MTERTILNWWWPEHVRALYSRVTVHIPLQLIGFPSNEWTLHSKGKAIYCGFGDKGHTYNNKCLANAPLVQMNFDCAIQMFSPFHTP